MGVVQKFLKPQGFKNPIQNLTCIFLSLRANLKKQLAMTDPVNKPSDFTPLEHRKSPIWFGMPNVFAFSDGDKRLIWGVELTFFYTFQGDLWLNVICNGITLCLQGHDQPHQMVFFSFVFVALRCVACASAHRSILKKSLPRIPVNFLYPTSKLFVRSTEFHNNFSKWSQLSLSWKFHWNSF